MSRAIVLLAAVCAVSCTSKGPAGSEGAAGPQGPTGPQGAQGQTGTPGAAGAPGIATYNVALEDGGTLQVDGGVLIVQGPAGPQGLGGPTGPSGDAGAPGQSVTGQSLALGDANCPNGGAAFTSASGTTYACTGAPGAAGPAGDAGPQGLAGIPVTSTPLDAGNPNCPNGGSAFTSVSGTSYACNGAGSPTQTIDANGSGGRNWSDGTFARSCYGYLFPTPGTGYRYAGSIASGVYTVQPDGPAGSPPFNVYCDMDNQGGGWTLVVGISGADQTHLDVNAVTPNNLTNPSAFGKRADTEINNLKSGISPGFRFSCASVTGYFPSNCEFIATVDASGPCTAESYAYPPSAYGQGRSSQGSIAGLADGDTGTANRLIYGDTAGAVPGCNDETGWGHNGTVWVR